MRKRYSTSDISDKILDAARELFIANGYTGTSIRDIAALSGANVAHIKYYYDSKANLFGIIFDEAFEILVRRLYNNFNSDAPFLEIVEKWIDIYYDILPENPQIPIFILNEINHNPEALVQKIIAKNPHGIFNKFFKKMEDEITLGRIKNIPVVDFAMNVLSLSVFPFMLKSIALRLTGKTDEEYTQLLKDHKKYVLDFVLNGLKP